MKLSSSVLDALIGGVAGFLLPPDMAKYAPPNNVPRVAIASCGSMMLANKAGLQQMKLHKA